MTPGFNGLVSFTCAGAPAAATCAVPMPIPVTSGIAAPFLVTVSTGGTAAATSFRLPAVFLGLYLLVGFLFYGIAVQTRERISPGLTTHPRLAYVLTVAAAALLALSFTAGCGGGSSVAQSAPITEPAVTPPGTSVLTVTLTASTSAGTPLAAPVSIQLTLIVQ